MVGGVVLMEITNLFAVSCGMAEPGGINEGGKGFPINYYSCGVWGESFSWMAVAVDFVILSFVVFLILKLCMRFAAKR